MPTNESRTTATVIPFPIERRRAANLSLFAPKHGPAHEAWPTVECGSGWYHETAMREAERARRS